MGLTVALSICLLMPSSDTPDNARVQAAMGAFADLIRAKSAVADNRFELSDVVQDSIFAKMQLKRGDVVGGTDGCHAILQGPDTIIMEVRRDGRDYMATYNVTAHAATLTPAAEYKGARPPAECPKARDKVADPKEARIVPSYADGVMHGLKAFSVPATDWFGARGVRSGDIIRRINGCELAPMERANQILGKAKAAAGTLVLEVQRKKELFALQLGATGTVETSPVDDTAGDREGCKTFFP